MLTLNQVIDQLIEFKYLVNDGVGDIPIYVDSDYWGSRKVSIERIEYREGSPSLVIDLRGT